MKITLLFFIIAVSIPRFAKAQTTTSIRRVSHRLNENTVVKDSAGTSYSPADRQKLMMTGNYTLKALHPESDSTAYLLVKLNEEEKNELMNTMPMPAESPYFKTGDKIESFASYDINWNKIRLKDLEGKIVVLNFWFIDCPPCRQEIPELNKIALLYAGDPDVVFIAVALDYKADLKRFIKTNPFAYHVIEYGRHIADSYGINSFPTNVILDKEGKVRFHASGLAINTPYWIKKTIGELKK